MTNSKHSWKIVSSYSKKSYGKMIVHFVTALLYSIHNLVDDLIQPGALALELFHIFSAYMGIVQKCFLLILVEFLRDGHLHFHIEAAFRLLCRCGMPSPEILNLVPLCVPAGILSSTFLTRVSTWMVLPKAAVVKEMLMAL